MIKIAVSGLAGIAIGVAVTSAAPALTHSSSDTIGAVRTTDAQPVAVDPYTLMLHAKDLPATEVMVLF